MAKYWVTMKIDARYVTEVEADSVEEARKKAEFNFGGADFGEASDIDGECVKVENEKGDYVWGNSEDEDYTHKITVQQRRKEEDGI